MNRTNAVIGLPTRIFNLVKSSRRGTRIIRKKNIPASCERKMGHFSKRTPLFVALVMALRKAWAWLILWYFSLKKKKKFGYFWVRGQESRVRESRGCASCGGYSVRYKAVFVPWRWISLLFDCSLSEPISRLPSVSLFVPPPLILLFVAIELSTNCKMAHISLCSLCCVSIAFIIRWLSQCRRWHLSLPELFPP